LIESLKGCFRAVGGLGPRYPLVRAQAARGLQGVGERGGFGRSKAGVTPVRVAKEAGWFVIVAGEEGIGIRG